MAIALTVSQYLAEHDVPYDVLTHAHTATSGESAEASHVPGSRLAAIGGGLAMTAGLA